MLQRLLLQWCGWLPDRIALRTPDYEYQSTTANDRWRHVSLLLPLFYYCNFTSPSFSSQISQISLSSVGLCYLARVMPATAPCTSICVGIWETDIVDWFVPELLYTNLWRTKKITPLPTHVMQRSMPYHVGEERHHTATLYSHIIQPLKSLAHYCSSFSFS